MDGKICSKIVGGGGSTAAVAEECEDSTESGWTMYICSDHYDDSCEDSDSSASNGHRVSKRIHHGDTSDDSMASDASSGHRGSDEKAKKLKQKKQRDHRHRGVPMAVKRGGDGLGESADAVKLPKSASAKHLPCLSVPKVRKNIWIDRIAK